MPPIEQKRLDTRRKRRFLGTTEGRHPDIASARGRFYDDRTPLVPDPPA